MYNRRCCTLYTWEWLEAVEKALQSEKRVAPVGGIFAVQNTTGVAVHT